jgi:hypothetical protein
MIDKTMRWLSPLAIIATGALYAFVLVTTLDGTPAKAAAPDIAQACTYTDAGTNQTKACTGVSSDSRPCRKAVAITPNDSTDLTVAARAIYVGVGGDVAVYSVDDSIGTSVTIKGAATAQVLPFWVRRVLATGTTATNLVGCVG